MRMTKKGFRDARRKFRDDAETGRRSRDPKPGTKRAVNLSVDAEILAAAKAQGINLSQTLEDELRRLTDDARVKKWQEKNRAAIDSHNRFVDEHGVWSEKYRSWGRSG